LQTEAERLMRDKISRLKPVKPGRQQGTLFEWRQPGNRVPGNRILQHFQLRYPSTRLHYDVDYIIASNLPRCNIVSIGVTFAHRIEE